MRPAEQWLCHYSRDHQHPTHRAIHWVCVPAILWAFYAALRTLPVPGQLSAPGNWSWLAMTFALVFYFRMSRRLGWVMLSTFSSAFSRMRSIGDWGPCGFWPSPRWSRVGQIHWPRLRREALVVSHRLVLPHGGSRTWWALTPHRPVACCARVTTSGSPLNSKTAVLRHSAPTRATSPGVTAVSSSGYF